MDLEPRQVSYEHFFLAKILCSAKNDYSFGGKFVFTFTFVICRSYYSQYLFQLVTLGMIIGVLHVVETNASAQRLSFD